MGVVVVVVVIAVVVAVVAVAVAVPTCTLRGARCGVHVACVTCTW